MLPAITFLTAYTQPVRQRIKEFRMSTFSIAQAVQGIFQTPGCNPVGVPVVIYVILIFVRSGYAQHDILLFIRAPINALGPEPADGNQNIQSMRPDITRVPGITDVVVNGKSNGTIAVYFLKSYFPFVVAFFTIDGHHREEGRAIAKAQFFCIFNCFAQLLMAIQQEVSCNLWRLCCQVKRDAIRLGIPVGYPPVFLARETFWPDIQSGILTGIRLVKLKDIVADGLLSSHITKDLDITFSPDCLPSFGLFFLQLVKLQWGQFRQARCRNCLQACGRMVFRCYDRYSFFNAECLRSGYCRAILLSYTTIFRNAIPCANDAIRSCNPRLELRADFKARFLCP
ncbi:hypothetical protein D3C73_766290 [compost metagenome]